MVTSFRYPVRVILAAEDDWPEVVKNLSWSRAVWRRMTRILSREGVAPWVSGFFFKAVVQAVLIFGSETWVVNPRMVKALGGFQVQLARRLTGRLPRRTPGGKWTYTSTATARGGVGLLTMEEYIRRSHNTVTQYIATRSLLELCEGSERASGGASRDAVVGTGGD